LEVFLTAMSDETSTHIGCLIVRKVCGKAGKGLQQEIEGWIACNGKEWTCNRIKAIWNASLHLRNGDREQARLVFQENSIAYHKRTMLPKGNWSFVVRHFVTAQRPSVIRRYAAVLRYYTSLKLNRVSVKQQRKFVGAITSPSKTMGNVSIPWIESSMKKELMNRVRLSRIKSQKGLHTLISALQREYTKPYHELLSGSSYYFSDQKPDRRVRNLPYGSFVHSWITSMRTPSILSYDLPNLVDTNLMMMDLGGWIGDQHMGRICVLQEQGCKARVVNQPSARVQYGFYPLHSILSRLNRELFPRESCVEDQVKGIYTVLDHLESGNDVYSVDLSSATDRFPRRVSNQLLLSLGLTKYAQAMEQYCQEEFPLYYDNKLSAQCLKYSVGQPMGLYGSFPLFHMSNLLVASIAWKRMEQVHKNSLVSFHDGTCFRVLGDDIVISDKRIAHAYCEIMRTLGCEISVNKSFSGKVAEFAGFVAVPASRGRYTAFRPYKVPEGARITNPLEFLHGLGIKASSVSPYWERMFQAYSRTLGQRDLSLSPLIPNEERPIGYSKASSQWMNALAQRVLDLEDIGNQNQDDRPDHWTMFQEHSDGESTLGFVPSTYIPLDEASKRRRRNRNISISQDPLIKEALLKGCGDRPPDHGR